jgi:general secretion pathway protein A
MRFLLLELGCEISADMDLVSMHELFNRCLLQEAHAGRRFIVVVDEAQNLDPSVLETIRLLSDFETPQAKLLQIVLSGQPQLADKLSRPSLRQLRQRVSLLSTLKPLPPDEVAKYIEHRLRAAGRPDNALFTSPAIKMIAEMSEGIPRNINNICFNALSLGCALRQQTIDVDVLRQVAADFDLAGMVSDPGGDFDTLPHAISEAQSILTKTNAPVPKARQGELLNSEDALAYIQEFIRRFKKDQFLAN